MRAQEFIAETTVSGGIATVALPMGAMVARDPARPPTDKYTTTSRKPASDVNRRFKNSFSK